MSEAPIIRVEVTLGYRPRDFYFEIVRYFDNRGTEDPTFLRLPTDWYVRLGFRGVLPVDNALVPTVEIMKTLPLPKGFSHGLCSLNFDSWTTQHMFIDSKEGLTFWKENGSLSNAWPSGPKWYVLIGYRPLECHLLRDEFASLGYILHQFEPYPCDSCGKTVLPLTGKNRSVRVLRQEPQLIPDSLPVATCTGCGERYFSVEEMDLLADYLYRQEEQLREVPGWLR